MAGVNKDDANAYGMTNLSSGDKEDHLYETATENSEQNHNGVGSDECTSARTTQSSPIANVNGSDAEDHIYETVTENTEIPCTYVASDGSTLSGIHGLQTHSGSANTGMKKECKIVLIIISITLVVMAVAASIVVVLTWRTQALNSFCTLDSDCKAVLNSVCSGSPNKTTCTCKPGYKTSTDKKTCTKVLTTACTYSSECSSVSNSTCSGNSSKTCTCEPGYKTASDQLSCTTVLSNACINDSDCSVVSNSACSGNSNKTCTCKPGYKPSSDQSSCTLVLTNDCIQDSQCIAVANSVCSGTSKKTCECKPGFKPTSDQLSCTIDINECTSRPCMNGATCVDGITKYSCKCALGYAGTTCEIDINECVSSPCMNGATCTNGINMYTCKCSPGFSGINCQIVNEAQGRTPSNTLNVTNGDSYPESYWGNITFCPPGTFATGYIKKIEYLDWDDATGLNAIRLFCSGLGGVDRDQISMIKSLEGPWGDWTPEEHCPKGTFLVSFKLQVQPYQGSKRDDTSVNYVKFKCRDFAGKYTTTELSSRNGLRGEWGSWSQTCDPHSAICGLKTLVERIQHKGDDTALNDVIFYCCNQLY